jgi:hypothetical protein
MMHQIEPSFIAQNAQIVGYQHYAIKNRNSNILSRIDSDIDGHFRDNDIRIRGTNHECPSIWKEGPVTATQIIEGKTSRKVMRSQKLVLCLVENEHRIWFEVAGLSDDLTYPLEPHLVGIRVFPFEAYKEAKAQFVSLVNWTKRATKAGKARGIRND